jgi:hypothetical protein
MGWYGTAGTGDTRHTRPGSVLFISVEIVRNRMWRAAKQRGERQTVNGS